MAKQLMLPANRAFDSNGFAVPGATASLYQSGTLTPATFYADADLTTALGPTITANGAGRFDQLPYQDENTAFRLIVRDAIGVQLDDIDPFFFGSSIWGTITLAAGAAVGTRTALAAITSPASGQSAILTESGREGSFTFSTAALSAEVTADPGQWSYVAPTSDTSGASGAWVRKSRTALSGDLTLYVRADGSDGNDGTADTAAAAFATLDHAIDIAHRIFDCGGHKITIQIADGTYTVASLISGKLVGARDSASQPFQVIGNEAAPGNVILNGVGDNLLTLANGAYLLLAGVTLAHDGTGGVGRGVLVETGATLEHRNCVFGAIKAECVLAQHHTTVRAVGPTTVTGDADSFIHATKRSIVDFSSQTITFTGSPAFTTYLWGINDASVNLDSATIVGTATGGITVHDRATLNVAGLTGTYLGGSAPLIEDGGIIIGDRVETRTIYVRTDGNDANDGAANTADRAFKTVQAAINSVSKRDYDPIWWDANNGVVFQLGGPTGTFSEAVTLQDIPYRWAMILGDETTPSNITINSGGASVTSTAVRTRWFVRGVQLRAAGGDNLHAEQGANITFRNVEFHDASQANCFAYLGGTIIADGNYAIVGGAAIHLRAWMGGIVDINGRTVTITNTPAFSPYFAEARLNGVIRATGATFTGSATGQEYYAETGGVIFTDGVTLPGNVAGATGTGGQFA